MCALCPLFAALSAATHAGSSIGVFALVILADLVLEVVSAAIMYQGSNIVGLYYDRLVSQRFRALWGGILLCAATLWVAFSVVLGGFVAQTLIRLQG
jgi:hypothetical protein